MDDNKQNSSIEARLPKEPIDTVIGPLKEFLHIEAASGVMLLSATVIALFLANSGFSDKFLGFWKTPMAFGIGSFRMDYSLQHWINDGMMAIFFFVVGLEIKREMVMGELRDFRQAIIPLAAALGGMIIPAGIYLMFQAGEPAARGWAIPMATDIAFVVGCLAVLGSRVPNSLRIMLLTLAIADDIGAILVIAIAYTDSLSMLALGFGALGIAVIYFLLRVGCRNIAVYLMLMFLVWLAFHESGVHATIAGVILGLMMPAKAWISQDRLSLIVQKTNSFLRGQGWNSNAQRYTMLREMEIATRKSLSPLERFETELHPWVGFVIMPVFALANAGVAFEASDFTSPVAVAVLCGLCFGKPIGVMLFSWIAVKMGLGRLPEGVTWPVLLGGSFLTGIGFTMALFISSLALEGEILDAAKVGVLGASLLCAIVGVVLLVVLLPKKVSQ